MINLVSWFSGFITIGFDRLDRKANGKDNSIRERGVTIGSGYIAVALGVGIRKHVRGQRASFNYDDKDRHYFGAKQWIKIAPTTIGLGISFWRLYGR